MNTEKQEGQKGPQEKKYKPQPMISWFHPALLFRAAMEVVVSSLFGNYADRREMQAALDMESGDKDGLPSNTPAFDYSGEEELWIDFAADTGDGFNATFSVASCLAKEELTVNDPGKFLSQRENTALKLPQGKILVLGGDQIYPAPTREGYEQRFRIPFKTAFPLQPGAINRPHLYAIPGNHDWYDGLGNFLKIFCQQRWIGNWETHQRRSYFALRLPHRYWLWAIDIQLNEDIDEPQLQYFMKVGRNLMEQGDKVILVTAKPAWVYHEEVAKDESYKRLKFFIEKYITDDEAGCVGKTFVLTVILTGDLHYYAHYQSGGGNPLHYIGAGGGGAALHLTHDVPERLEKVERTNKEDKDAIAHGKATGSFRVEDIKLKAVYPSKELSKKLRWQNLLFFRKNSSFGFLFAGVYLLLFWFIQSTLLPGDQSYLDRITNKDWRSWLEETRQALGYTPAAIILCLLVLLAFWGFGDNSRKSNGNWFNRFTPKIFAALHGLILCGAAFLAMWGLASVMDYNDVTATWGHLVIMGILVFATGFVFSGFLMGWYLLVSNLIFHNHTGDGSASLAIEDYKNFLRLHLTAEKLTIYPVGIGKVTKKWEIKGPAGDPEISGEAPPCHLIEKPIEIPPPPGNLRIIQAAAAGQPETS